MFISKRVYKEAMERAWEKGRQEAFREMREAEREHAREKEMEMLRREVASLKYQLETKNAAKTIHAVPEGKACPPDRLDI